MKTKDTKTFIGIIEDELNAVTSDAVRHVISHLNNDKDRLFISYVVYDDFSIEYIIEVRLEERFVNINCNIHKFITISGDLFINSHKLKLFEDAIKKAERIINKKDAE